MIRRRPLTTRLNRTSERQNKRQTIYFSIGIIVLIIALMQFGPILINIFGNIIYSLKGGSDSTIQITGTALIQSPVLHNIPEATQDSSISIKGRSPNKNGSIEIYVNDDLEKEIEINDDINFEAAEVPLQSGQNNIKARFVKKDKSSAFSENYIVNYIKEKPTLEVTFPQDGMTFTRADKNIQVKGKTSPENEVSINGFRAIVDPDGEFSYQLQLNDGDNQIAVEVKNPAGANTISNLVVKYNP